MALRTVLEDALKDDRLDAETRRSVRALMLLGAGRVRLLGWTSRTCVADVASEDGVMYRVTLDAHDGWLCDCEDHVIRGAQCKHIRAAMWLWGSLDGGLDWDV